MSTPGGTPPAVPGLYYLTAAAVPRRATELRPGEAEGARWFCFEGDPAWWPVAELHQALRQREREGRS